jgi:hypothetical protein
MTIAIIMTRMMMQLPILPGRAALTALVFDPDQRSSLEPFPSFPGYKVGRPWPSNAGSLLPLAPAASAADENI